MSEIITLDTTKETIQYIVVNIGSEQYGIDISYIDNIVRMQKITRVPKTLEHYLGVINLRGEVVPVMSIRRKMGLEEDEFTDASRIIILKPSKENTALVGVTVDSVKEVVTLAVDDIDQNNQKTTGENGNFINGIGKNGEELISIFELSAVVDDVDAQ